MTNVVPFHRQLAPAIQAQLLAAVATRIDDLAPARHPVLTAAEAAQDAARNVLREVDALQAEFHAGGMPFAAYRRRNEALQQRTQDAIGPFVEALWALSSWRPATAEERRDRLAKLAEMTTIETDADDMRWAEGGASC